MSAGGATRTRRDGASQQDTASRNGRPEGRPSRGRPDAGERRSRRTRAREDRETAIRVDGVTKTFDDGDVTALDDVSFTMPAGQLVVLIGRSGSGKSTLLRHVNGLTRPTRGSVEVLGVDVTSAGGGALRDLRRRVGFIFQQFNLVGRSTCLENVLTGALGRVRGPRFGVVTYPRALRRQALEQLERVGLPDKAFQRANTLSGGQQQRVGIARALMQEPDIVLADEPVASLDPETSREVMETLFRICTEDGLTVACSLHQVDLAMGWAHRLIGLRQGRVALDESTEGLSTEEAMEVYQRVDEAAEVEDVEDVEDEEGGEAAGDGGTSGDVDAGRAGDEPAGTTEPEAARR